ncbi:hypothetical protein RNZ50_23805 [Paracoccaceae bacterium Fryx2]|nr:hypothetical protein [Paracoccaceae bacterium Fryx2]
MNITSTTTAASVATSTTKAAGNAQGGVISSDFQTFLRMLST